MSGAEDDEATAAVRLVGREPEQAVIEGWLHGGTGGTLVLSGEPGVGTRPCCARRGRSAASAGYRRLEVGRLPGETEVSYAAFDRLLLPLRPQLGGPPPVHRGIPRVRDAG